MRIFVALQLLLMGVFSTEAFSEIKVVTTTANLKSLVEEIGGDEVSVVSLAKPHQDPHFLEAKPSYMLKVAKADLLIQIGLGLEAGWLPLIIRGAKNPNVRPGQKGHLFASKDIDLIEKMHDHEHLTRADGDVHPEGNPHFMLDPMRAARVGFKIAEKLGSLLPNKKDLFQKNSKIFYLKMKKLVDIGQKALESKNKKIITYLKTLNYFADRFKLQVIDYLEPKPGIPPTASHILHVIQEIKKQQPHHILIEEYFDATVAKRIKREIPQIEIHHIPVSVNHKEIVNLETLYQSLIAIISDTVEL